MRAGGTLDLDALNDDVAQIVDGNYATSVLVQLPLIVAFNALNQGPVNNTPFPALDGARPDLSVPVTAANPILGAVTPTRFNLQQPANSIQLVWDCIDANGNYQASYPINSVENYQGNSNQYPSFSCPAGFFYATDNGNADINGSGGMLTTNPYPLWAKGFIRLNGQGIWFPMSLLPSSERYDSPITINPGGANALTQFGGSMIKPNGGFSSLTGPISFFDWIGYWDGAGDVTTGPNGPNAFILAVISTNLSTASNRVSSGAVANYATPNSSGRKEGQAVTVAAQRGKDILVPATGKGKKKGC